MAVPAFRTSPSRKNKRRSHLALRRVVTVVCPNCGSARRPHAACPSCGFVRPGLQIRGTEDI